MKLNSKQYETLFNKNKYKNTKVVLDGITFDSKKEAKRYNELVLMQKAGMISNLELQKTFELQPKYISCKGEKIRAITYKGDFYYYNKELGKYIIEDTKGMKTEVYKLKKKLLEYKYDITIDEI